MNARVHVRLHGHPAGRERTVLSGELNRRERVGVLKAQDFLRRAVQSKFLPATSEVIVHLAPNPIACREALQELVILACEQQSLGTPRTLLRRILGWVEPRGPRLAE